MLEYAVNYSRSAMTYIEIVTDELSGTRRWIVRHEMEWYRKYALSAACLLFCLIGIPLGSLIRKGGFGLSVVVSVFIFLMYYIISTTVESTVKELVVPAGWGMWLSTLLLLPLGLYLVVSVSSDNLRINPRVLNKILNILEEEIDKAIAQNWVENFASFASFPSTIEKSMDFWDLYKNRLPLWSSINSNC